MWRLHVWARHLRKFREVGLLEIGLAMLDGSYWEEGPDESCAGLYAGDPAVDFSGGD